MSEQRAPQQTGSELIAAERQRQIVKEGWTHEHDQTHQAGDLSQAGICYATMGNLQITMNINAAPVGVAKNWPWSRHWWKPANNPIRNLVKAGALIAAEIDRLLDDEPAAPLPESQPSPSGDEQRLYMIQDTRSYCGNDVMWWCVDGAGYTTDVDKAWKLPKAEAESKCCRATDVIWPAKEILDCSRRAFDMQRFREIRAALQESPSDRRSAALAANSLLRERLNAIEKILRENERDGYGFCNNQRCGQLAPNHDETCWLAILLLSFAPQNKENQQ